MQQFETTAAAAMKAGLAITLTSPKLTKER